MFWFGRKPGRLATGELPIPPLEMRKLVGSYEEHTFNNPSGERMFAGVDGSSDNFIFDFGCGCGRIARQLLQQHEPPRRYVGVDLHKGMVRWCRRNLQPRHSGFEFHHQDVFNAGLNPRGKLKHSRFPASDNAVSLLVAVSVFTHVLEDSAVFYLNEMARVLGPNGKAVTTFFLFDKASLPMMQDFQNALFINARDPTNAVIFDRAWLKTQASSAGLRICAATPPSIRGFHWSIQFEPAVAGVGHVAFPEDNAPVGTAAPPLLPRRAHKLDSD
jgi:SAM-dependent methyltransferase